MEIMTMLDTKGMNQLRSDFERQPDGLSLEDFIKLIILRLPDTGMNDVELVAKLQDLFHQVDVNGDGTMEWEEFSEFCIEAGIAASQMSNMEVTEKYQQRDFSDGYSHSNKVEQILFVSELQKLFVCEGGSKLLKVYDPHDPEVGMRLLHEIDIAEAMMDKTENVGSVVNVEYIETGIRKLLAISASNMSISFWDAGIYDISEESSPRFLFRYVLDKPQFVMEWIPHLNCLFTASADNKILVHHLRFTPELDVKEICQLHHHSDLISDIVAVPEYKLVATASLDKKIFLWGMDEDPSLSIDRRLFYKSQRVGHQKGVRSLAYADHGLLLSASFDLVVLGWDITGLSLRPVFQLIGHTAPLFAVRVLPSKQHALTVDIHGFFKTWDIRREGSIMDSERNIQTFSVETLHGGAPTTVGSGGNSNSGFGLEDDACIFSPHAVDVTYPRGSIIVGKNRLVIFDTVQLQPEKFSPIACLYNPTSLTIACAIHRDVKVWDALTGQLLTHFQNIASSDLTSLCLDFRERKFIASDQSGVISVYNYLNGSKMKDSALHAHESEIACLVYGKEDKVIVSAGWDKSLRVYDERIPTAVMGLRQVHRAHPSDVSALALSHHLSLIASGDDCGVVRLWDFQFLTLEGEMHLGKEIVSLLFCEPYPVLLSVDCSGNLRFWPVRPFSTTSSLHRNACAACYNIFRDGFDETVDRVTSVQLAPKDDNETKSSTQELFIGTSRGLITILDILPTIQSLGIAKVCDDKSLPFKRENYSPYRKLQVSFEAQDQEEAAKVSFAEMIQAHLVAPLQKHCFAAHRGTVNSMQILSDPKAILTCSSDKTIRLWTHSGQLLGQLDSNERKALHMGRSTKTWSFPVDLESRKNKELEQAERLVQSIMKTTNEAHSQSFKEQGVSNELQAQRIDFMGGSRNDRRRLSNLMAYEEQLKSIQKMKDAEALKKRRNERRKRIEHIRELNAASPPSCFDPSRRGVPNGDNDGDDQDDDEDGTAGISLLAAIVHGEVSEKERLQRERDRVLGQLDGKQTWVKTQQELAQEAAAAVEEQRKKKVQLFTEKLESASKKKSKKKKKNKSKGKDSNKTASRKKVATNSNQGTANGKLKPLKSNKDGSGSSEKKKKNKNDVLSPDALPSNAAALEGQVVMEEKSKNDLYGNLKQELQRIDAKSNRIASKKVDTKPPELLKKYMDELKLQERISKRHAMSAPILSGISAVEASSPVGGEGDATAEEYTIRGENKQMRAFNWKIVADKVMKELQADLSECTPYVGVSPNILSKSLEKKMGRRLSAISARVSQRLSFIAQGKEYDIEGEDSDEDDRDDEKFQSDLDSSDSDSSSRSSASSASDSDDESQDSERVQKKRKGRKSRNSRRQSERTRGIQDEVVLQFQKAAKEKLGAAREKLQARISKIVAKAEADREKRRSAQRLNETDAVKRHASQVQSNVHKVFDPTKEQLKRIRTARYFGPYLRQDVSHVRSIFQSIDTDSTGTIELHEFQNEIKKTSSQSGNFRSLLDQSVSMFQSIDRDKSGTVALEELARVLFNQATAQELDDIIVFLRMPAVRQKRQRKAKGAGEKNKSTRNFRAEIKALFDLYDLNKDGELTVYEMQDAIHQNGLLYHSKLHGDFNRGLSYCDLNDLLNDIDHDKSRTIQFDEFYQFFVEKWS